MTALIGILLLLIAINVWATRRVISIPEELGVPKRMLIAGVWIIPFFGAFIAKTNTPSAAEPETSQTDRASSISSDAPLLLTCSGAADFMVSDHLAFANGVPILDWNALSEWALTCGSSEAAAFAKDQGRLAWLLHLRDAIGPEAHVHVADDSYILSTLEPNVVQATARYIATSKRRIARVLGELADFPPDERSLLIVFDSEEEYYDYVSLYYPSEGEFALSGGMFINAGCPHFVVRRADLSSIEPVIAHELTHSAVAHLQLPRWLDEGLAVNTEHKVAGAQSSIHTPHELHRMHLGFWNAERIQEFWSGESFNRTDDGNLLSYELARIIVAQMASQWDVFARFVASAKREDSGADSARTHLSVLLGAYAATLLQLGEGESWEPAPEAWASAGGI